MIFAAFGNAPHPFIRLAAALDEYAATICEEVIVQCGNTHFDFMHAKATDFFTQNEFQFHLKTASVVVLQGGWGGISEASDMSCKIVVVPRKNGIEHNHDQDQLVRKLEQMGVVLAVYDISELAASIDSAKSHQFKPIVRGNASKIISEKLKEWYG